MRMAARLQAMGMQKYAGTTRKSGRRRVWTGRINIDDEALSAPLRWRKPLRIFVNSMSDLFQEGINEQLIERIWNVMESAKWHTFQILTKRPERMRSIVERLPSPLLPNVWLGTSVERSDFAHRIDDLRHIPARIRFVSFEPLLGPIVDPDLSHIHWAIIGGESGPHARPIERSWVEDLKQSCERQGVAFFFKQWGGTRKKQTGRILGNRTWDEYPSTGSII
jgi:protein gp37